ncbi:MAG TPA: type II toxin-antitoxin system HicA family toxin [Streptosporangiaceae bacterium]
MRRDQHPRQPLRLRHPDGRATTVPVHAGRDVPRGTLRSV